MKKVLSPVPGFLLLCVARFMVMLDLSIVILALPAMGKDFHVPASMLPWVLTIYAVTFGGFLLLAGKAGDLLGKRRLVLWGFAVFTLASFAGGLAQNLTQFVIARGFQGLGAALLSPNAFALVVTLFQDPKGRSRAIGLWSALSGVALPLGGLLGGLLVSGPGWRWVMLLNVPLGVLSLGATGFLIPRGEVAAPRPRLDWAGAFLVTAGLIALVFALSEGVRLGWVLPIATVVGIGLLVLFVLWEKRSRHPLVRLELFRDRTLVGANLTMGLGMAGLVSCLFALTFFGQHTLGISPISSGLLLLPMSVVFIACTLGSARLARSSPRLTILTGTLLMALGFAVLSFMVSGPGVLGWYLAGSLLVGAFGLALPVIFQVGVAGAPRSDQGLASGLLNTSQQIGAGLGLAVSTAVATTTQNTFLVCAAFLIVAAWTAATLMGPRLSQPQVSA